MCRPHAYRDSNITERTGTRVAKYVTPVIIFSAIYNIPKFLEYKVSRNVRKCSIYHSESPGCFKTKHSFSVQWFSGHWSMYYVYEEIINVSQHRQDNQIK